jgi:hypothetical protein
LPWAAAERWLRGTSVQHFKDMSIRTKMYGGYAVVLVLLLAVAAAGLWSGQSVFSATRRIGTGTEPRVRAAEKIQFDESSVYGYQTSYVLGEVASQRKGFETYVGIVQADIQTLRHFATDARYRAELASIVDGVNGFLATDRTIWRDVNAGTPAAKAQAANLTLNAETTPYGQMLDGATAYLKSAQADQTAALARPAATIRPQPSSRSCWPWWRWSWAAGSPSSSPGRSRAALTSSLTGCGRSVTTAPPTSSAGSRHWPAAI